MDVATIEMPAEVAREHLKEYRKGLHRRADAEYQEVMLGLEALAEGTPLLTLASVFATVPRDAKGRPMVAIARADRFRVFYSRPWGRPADRFDCAYDVRGGARQRVVDGVTEIPMRESVQSQNGYALVPIVPPRVRGTLDLKRHFTLWEVERWADHSRDVGPDIDPLLLRRISSDLYAVVGSWDLTPLEQAILAGRRER